MCGTFVTRYAKHLNSSSRCFSCRPKVNYQGKRSGHLVALKYIYTRKPNNLGGKYAVWEFLCEACHKIVQRTAGPTFSNKIDNCGCLKAKKVSNSKKHISGAAILHAAFQSHLKSAKKRSIPCELTKEQYAATIKMPCTYCGGFSVRKSSSSNKIFTEALKLNSVDRLNNEPCYKIENSVSACFTCQFMKGSLSALEFVEQSNRISVYSSRRKD